MEGDSPSQTDTLPAYCFQATGACKEPEWCVPTNPDYVSLCNEVDQINDRLLSTMCQLQTWPDGDDSESQQVDFYINVQQKHVTVNSTQITLEDKQIRYCYMLNQNSLEGATGHVLVLSYWQPDYTGQVKTMLLAAEEEATTIKVMNLLRKIIGDLDRLRSFVPLVVGPMCVHKGSVDLMSIESVPQGEYTTYMVTVDEELISFYPGDKMKSGESDVLRFTRDAVDEAVEKIYAHTVHNLVEIETQRFKYLFKERPDHVAPYKRFAFYVQGRIKAKEGIIFNFSTPNRFAEHMAEFPTKLYQEDLPSYVPVTAPPGASARVSASASQRSGGPNAPPFRRQMTDPQGGNGGETPRSRSGSQEDTNKTDMETLLVSLTSSTSSLEGISEDLQIMWFTMEADIDSMIQDGLVPETDVLSGGLDENSYEHFYRAIKAIQDALFGQSVDRALSLLHGVRETFKACKYQVIKDWLSDHSDKEMLKQIYFTGSR